MTDSPHSSSKLASQLVLAIGISVVALTVLSARNLAADEPATAKASAAPASAAVGQVPDQADKKLRIVILGAHPDDAEYYSGGTAALWAAGGNHVEMVSVTNGDIGHFAMSGGALAQRRAAEVKMASQILGTSSLVLDNHDGELMPTLENRRTLTQIIRRWDADIVIGHRPSDYHPDHRCVGALMQDCAFMVNVPFFCPGRSGAEEDASVSLLV